MEILSDAPGFGKHAARKGDLLLLHYVGEVQMTHGRDNCSVTAVRTLQLALWPPPLKARPRPAIPTVWRVLRHTEGYRRGL